MRHSNQSKHLDKLENGSVGSVRRLPFNSCELYSLIMYDSEIYKFNKSFELLPCIVEE